MKNLVLPENRVRPLPFYLAMEEWAARNLPADEYFFTWRVAPTVIIGRHQDLSCEIDTAFCRDNGIDICRRKSGGGAVFADMGNVMFSYITPDEHVTATFARFTAAVAAMLRGLGLDAEAGGRNDVLVGGRKISGNSYYHLAGRSIVHGTMLHSIDAGRMAGALTPSRSKLESHRVQSVESRVTCLSEHTPISIGDFIKYATATLTDSALELGDEDVAEIGRMAEPYFSPGWLEGARAPKGNAPRHINGVGEIAVEISESDGSIGSIRFIGDFFDPYGRLAALSASLTGAPLTRSAIMARMDDAGAAPEVIPGLTAGALTDLILQH